MNLFSSLHSWLKTETALKKEVGEVKYYGVDLGAHFRESMLYHQDFVHEWSHTENHLGLHSGPGGRRTLSGAVRGLMTRQDARGVHSIPVADLHGVGASKSGSCRSLEDLAYRLQPRSQYTGSKPIWFETEADYLRNVAEVDREFYGRGVTALYREWDGKLFVDNTDMSHHLAAVYRQCKEQGRQHYLNLPIQVLRIDQANGRFILDNYYPLVLNPESRYRLGRVLERFGIESRWAGLSGEHEILYISKAGRGVKPAKAGKRAKAVFDEIRRVGAGGFFDLKEYLEGLLSTVGTSPYGPHAG
ncbi:MAG TPA: hypothetical protein VF736_14345 [Pyrinomonadaceae bacterium]|jgi:hypothetical protein